MHKTKKEQDSMGTQRYSILYSSKTGNTKKLAEKIREVLSEETCIPRWMLRHYEWHYKDIMIEDLTILSEFLGFEIKITKKQAHH